MLTLTIAARFSHRTSCTTEGSSEATHSQLWSSQSVSAPSGLLNYRNALDMQPDPSQLRTQQARKRPRRTQQGARERNVKTMGQNAYGDMGMTHDGAQPADGQMYDPSTGQVYADGQPFEMQIK